MQRDCILDATSISTGAKFFSIFISDGENAQVMEKHDGENSTVTTFSGGANSSEQSYLKVAGESCRRLSGCRVSE